MILKVALRFILFCSIILGEKVSEIEMVVISRFENEQCFHKNKKQNRLTVTVTVTNVCRSANYE